MADLFIDIRDREIRTVVADNGEVRFRRTYTLKAFEPTTQSRDGQNADQSTLDEGELAEIISKIRSDSGIQIEQAHLIVPTTEIKSITHKVQRMPYQEAFRLLMRKTVEKTGDETTQIILTPMVSEQNSQEWLAEYVPADTLRAYKKEFAAVGLKLKTAASVIDSSLRSVSHIRESIFNADAIFEINATTIEAYYISASSMLLHETLTISDDGLNTRQEAERSKKRRVYSILDLLYRVNFQYQSAFPMTPLHRVWLCGTDTNIVDLSAALQDAMDVETGLLSDDKDSAFVPLNGLLKAYQEGTVANFIHPDLLRRFSLRKKYGILVYIATALLAAYFIVTSEHRHSSLKKQLDSEKNKLAVQKSSQATSATIAKNLDLLRKLSGSQVLFYPMFRELATSLPDGVYLDTFNFSNKDNHDTLDISATFLQASDLGTQKTLTKLIDVMNRSPYLRHYREPTVISSTKDLKKTMTVKFTCEVNPLDTAK